MKNKKHTESFSGLLPGLDERIGDARDPFSTCPKNCPFFNREWTRIHANRLRKNSAGRCCEQETLRQRFLAQPDGQHGLRRVLRSQHSFSAI
jgi:hypothetical protein